MMQGRQRRIEIPDPISKIEVRMTQVEDLASDPVPSSSPSESDPDQLQATLQGYRSHKKTA